MNASDSTASWRQEQVYCAQSPLGNDRRPWTAARCVRLIRPLSSKLRTLERIIKAEAQRDTAARRPPLQQRDTIIITGGPNRDVSPKDDGWEQGSRPMKRVRRTYASRFRSCVFANGERAKGMDGKFEHISFLEVPKQLFALEEVSPPEIWEPGFALGQKLGKGDRWSSCKMPRGFQASTMSGKEKLNSGIRSSLEAILKATHSGIDNHKIGCRSLFSTCLRIVPYYMSEEASSLQNNDPDNEIDVSSATYDDLEEYGSLGTCGYKALRDVVRSHGVCLLSDSIAKGTFSPEDASASVQLCIEHNAYDEAQTLINALILYIRSAGRETALVSIENTRWILQVIQISVRKTGRYGFQFRCLSHLLEDEMFANIHKLTGSLSDCWNAAIRSLSLRDEHFESAAALLRTTIKSSYIDPTLCISTELHNARIMALAPSARPHRREDVPGSDDYEQKNTEENEKSYVSDDERRPISWSQDADTTASKILTILATIAILQQRDPDNARHPSLNACLVFLTDIVYELRHILDLWENSGRRSRMSSDQMALPLLAAGMSTSISSRESNHAAPSIASMGSVLDSLGLTEQGKNQAGTFVSAVAQCCQRIIPAVDGFGLIRSIIEGTSAAQLSAKRSDEGSNIRNTIAVVAAHKFCLTDSQPEHIEWAMMMENKVSRYGKHVEDSVLQCAPAQGNLRPKDDYRWEEGICEWIVKTPGPRPENASFSDKEIRIHDMSCNARSEQQSSHGCKSLEPTVALLSDMVSNTPSPAARCPTRRRLGEITLDRPVGREQEMTRNSLLKWQRSKMTQMTTQSRCRPQRLQDFDCEDELSTQSSEESMTDKRLRLRVGFKRIGSTERQKCHQMKARNWRGRTFYGSRRTQGHADRSRHVVGMEVQNIEAEDELSMG